MLICYTQCYWERFVFVFVNNLSHQWLYCSMCLCGPFHLLASSWQKSPMYLVLFGSSRNSKLINPAHLEIRLSKGRSLCLYIVCLCTSENLFHYSSDFLHDAQITLQNQNQTKKKNHADFLSFIPPVSADLCFPPLARGQITSIPVDSGSPGCTLCHWRGSATSVELCCPCNWPDLVILWGPVHTS